MHVSEFIIVLYFLWNAREIKTEEEKLFLSTPQEFGYNFDVFSDPLREAQLGFRSFHTCSKLRANKTLLFWYFSFTVEATTIAKCLILMAFSAFLQSIFSLATVPYSLWDIIHSPFENKLIKPNMVKTSICNVTHSEVANERHARNPQFMLMWKLLDTWVVRRGDRCRQGFHFTLVNELLRESVCSTVKAKQ